MNSARIRFRSGETIFGTGYGAVGIKAAELCFNTAITGYQEILTDPSYYKQILTFTFPHIGNVGTNAEDNESKKAYVSGMVTSSLPTKNSSWRSEKLLIDWMRINDVIGICNVDTRTITKKIRDEGAQDVAIEHSEDGIFSDDLLEKHLSDFSGLNGMDLTKSVSCKKPYRFQEELLQWVPQKKKINKKIVAIDYGIKLSILRHMASYGFEIIVVPASFSVEEILKLEPDGIILSNGPGDPSASNEYTGPVIKSLVTETELPIFGICLGHQLLGLALGASTLKMHHGHHGANHPVKDLESGKVLITSMNHGFAIDSKSLPHNLRETHSSLFDGSNCGIKVIDRPVFSVQFHPESGPGPLDANIIFHKFAMRVASE